MCTVLVVPLKKEITTKKVNSLTLSSKAPLLIVSSAKSKFRRRRPWLSFIKHQDCSAIATAHIHSRCVASFSLSAMTPADLSVFKVGQQINLVMNQVNCCLSRLTSFKAGGQLRSRSGCDFDRNIYTSHKYTHVPIQTYNSQSPGQQP